MCDKATRSIERLVAFRDNKDMRVRAVAEEALRRISELEIAQAAAA